MKTRPTIPRIPPLPESEWTAEQRSVLTPFLSGKRALNLMKTMARHWSAWKNLWGSHVMGPTQTLVPRERELLILRTGWRCEARYEWGHHVNFGKRAGLTDEEIERVKRGPGDPDWQPFDATLLRAADELHADHCVSDATWAALAARYDTRQLMDVVFTVGQYTQVCMILNSFGVQLDSGVESF